MTKREILAPAGGERALRAAVQSGADAVYLGGAAFNARQSADNFTTLELKKWVDYCHLFGVKVYVTVNTLIKEREIESLAFYAKELNRAGVDAVIVQDMGAVSVIRSVAPDLPVHASTQMTVTTLSGVEYLKRFGIGRVVLARELSKEQIKKIAENTSSEIEIFVHGALCMCYSGQCLMSSIIGGRSGNRGRCAQPCRLPFSLMEDGKTVFDGFLLSPKDLCLADSMSDVLDTKSVSYKIEGRLKRAEYVSAVTNIYKKYAEFPKAISDADKKELLDAFNRGGFTKGFFGSETGKNMMCHNNSSNVSENKFSDEAKKRASEDANERKIDVYMYAELSAQNPLSVTMWDDLGNSVTACSEICAEEAVSRPMSRERMEEQLKKLGNTPFFAVSVDADVDGVATIPISEINNVRRKAADALAALRIMRDARPEGEYQKNPYVDKKTSLEISVEVETEAQAEAAIECGISRIYVPHKLYDKFSDYGVIPKMDDISSGKKNISSKTIMAQNLADLYDYKNKEIIGGVRLNIYNSYSIEAMGLKHITLSPELNLYEIEDVCKKTTAKAEIIGYGRLTLMIMANCPVGASGKCQKNKNIYSLKDRKGEEFPLLCSEKCAMRLLNSKPLYMADKWESLKKTGADYVRLVFTTENKQETKKIIQDYISAKEGKEVPKMPDNTFTRGHFLRGVK